MRRVDQERTDPARPGSSATLRPVLIWMALLACAPAARSFEMYPVALKGGAYARETNVDLDAIVFQSEVDIGTCDLSKRRFTNGNYKLLSSVDL